MLSRRNNVPEKWLAEVLGSSSTTRTEADVARLAQEQRELKEYESVRCDGDGLDSEEKVHLCIHCTRFFFEKEGFGDSCWTWEAPMQQGVPRSALEVYAAVLFDTCCLRVAVSTNGGFLITVSYIRTKNHPKPSDLAPPLPLS